MVKVFKTLSSLVLATSLAISGIAMPVQAADTNTVSKVYISTQKENGKDYDGDLTEDLDYVNSKIKIVTSGSATVVDTKGKVKAKSDEAKQSYSVNFNSKEDLFNYGSSKNWTLYANFADTTLLRDYLTLELAQNLGLEFTPDHQFTEVYVDNKYKGLYLLVENIEKGSNKVDINTRKGDFVVEMAKENNKENNKDDIYFTTTQGISYRLCEPNDITDDINKYNVNTIEDRLSDIHDVISEGNYKEIKKVIDIDSFVNYYILNEFVKAYNFDGISAYFYYKDGKLYAGPAINYELSCGRYYNQKESSWGAFAADKHFYKSLMENEDFVKAVASKYNKSKKVLSNIYEKNGLIDSYYNTYKTAINKNYKDAPLAYTESGKDYNDELDYLKTWLSERQAWMTYYIAFKNGEDVNVTYVKAKDPTCTAKGNVAYYTIKGSGHYFKDADLTQELTEKEAILDPAHTWDAGKLNSQGKTEYTCTKCGAHKVEDPSKSGSAGGSGKNTTIINSNIKNTTVTNADGSITTTIEETQSNGSKVVTIVEGGKAYNFTITLNKNSNDKVTKATVKVDTVKKNLTKINFAKLAKRIYTLTDKHDGNILITVNNNDGVKIRTIKLNSKKARKNGNIRIYKGSKKLKTVKVKNLGSAISKLAKGTYKIK